MTEVKTTLGAVIDSIRELDEKDQVTLLKFLQSTFQQTGTSSSDTTEKSTRKPAKKKQAKQSDIVAALNYLGAGASLPQIWHDIRIRQSKPFALPKEETEGCQFILNRMNASPRRFTECPGGGYMLVGQPMVASAKA